MGIARLTRHEFLSGLHRVLQPRTYLEIGVEDGFGLALSRATTIGVDPDFHVTREVRAPLQLARATSDDFFARPDPVGFFGGVPIDLAFVDGMHLVEFAYRDLMNLERFSGPATVLAFDDVLPRTADEGARLRHSEFWAGDVYKLTGILGRIRPDLALLLVDTDPTGTLVVVGCDPASTVLRDSYEAEVGGAVAGDADMGGAVADDSNEGVPDSVLERHGAMNALDLLWWPGWRDIVRARAGLPPGSPSPADRVRADFPPLAP